MFKKLEAGWNARTPVYLHNGTKENLIFQLTLTVILISAMFAYDEWDERKTRRKLNMIDPQND